ncbi:MAG: hypothetical protein HC774_00345 [Sphingomonadales bacterium]|nr:hypothetical protein [Sphingomonadales bacterium]
MWPADRRPGAAGTALAFAVRTKAFPVFIGAAIDSSFAWVSAGGPLLLTDAVLGYLP